LLIQAKHDNVTKVTGSFPAHNTEDDPR